MNIHMVCLCVCRIDNLIYDTESLEVKAVIDWELATLGNPIQDMTGNLLQYILPAHLEVMAGKIYIYNNLVMIGSSTGCD